MSETTSPQAPESTRKVRPPVDIAITTVLTMVVVFLISDFSVATGVAVGSFAGFCAAAWNWFRMGRRRKALVHVLLGLGIYLLFNLCYVLLAVFLWRLLSPSVPADAGVNIPGDFPSVANVTLNPQTKGWIQIALLLFSLGAGVLVVTYLYKAAARDVQKIEPGSDLVEIYNFLPLLGVAATSVICIIVASTFLDQVHTAQIQNQVYCEALQLGMTEKDVDTALNKIGAQKQVWSEDTPYPSLSEKASYYRVVWWDNYHFDVDYNLSLWLGYDVNARLVWRGRYWLDTQKHEEGYDTIDCPWTFSQSVTAR